MIKKHPNADFETLNPMLISYICVTNVYPSFSFHICFVVGFYRL